MAFITCPECGRERVSDKAAACPECGFPLHQIEEPTEEVFLNNSEDVIECFLQPRKEDEEKIAIERDKRVKAEIELVKEKNRNKDKKMLMVLIACSLVIILSIIGVKVVSPQYTYNKQLKDIRKIIDSGDLNKLENISNKIMLFENKFCVSKDLIDSLYIDAAQSLLVIDECGIADRTLINVSDENKIVELKERISIRQNYKRAQNCYDNGDYVRAYESWKQCPETYMDVKERIEEVASYAYEIYYERAIEKMKEGSLGDAINELNKINGEYKNKNYYFDRCIEYSKFSGVWNLKSVRYYDENDKFMYEDSYWDKIVQRIYACFYLDDNEEDFYPIVKMQNNIDKYGENAGFQKNICNVTFDGKSVYTWQCEHDDDTYIVSENESFDITELIRINEKVFASNNKEKSVYRYTDVDFTINKNDVSSYYNNIEIYTIPSIGMTRDEVENSAWGKPQKKNISEYEWATKEQWVYSLDRYVYFTDGIVTSVSYSE